MDETKSYRLKPVSMGDVAPGYNLRKVLELAEYLEDEEIARMLELNTCNDSSNPDLAI